MLGEPQLSQDEPSNEKLLFLRKFLPPISKFSIASQDESQTGVVYSVLVGFLYVILLLVHR